MKGDWLFVLFGKVGGDFRGVSDQNLDQITGGGQACSGYRCLAPNDLKD